MEYISFATITQPSMLERSMNAIVDELTALRTLLNELKTDMSAHTHGGITADGDTSGVGETISAATVTQQIARAV